MRTPAAWSAALLSSNALKFAVETLPAPRSMMLMDPSGSIWPGL